jgi:hypothetical protein
VLILRRREYVHCSLRGSIEQFFSRNNKSFAFQFIDRKRVFYKPRKRPKQPPPKTRLQLKDVDTSYNGHLQTKHGQPHKCRAPQPTKAPEGKEAKSNSTKKGRTGPLLLWRANVVQAAGLDSGLNLPTAIGAPNARPP